MDQNFYNLSSQQNSQEQNLPSDLTHLHVQTPLPFNLSTTENVPSPEPKASFNQLNQTQNSQFFDYIGSQSVPLQSSIQPPIQPNLQTQLPLQSIPQHLPHSIPQPIPQPLPQFQSGPFQQSLPFPKPFRPSPYQPNNYFQPTPNPNPYALPPNPQDFVQESTAQRMVRSFGLSPAELPLVEKVLIENGYNYREATNQLLILLNSVAPSNTPQRLPTRQPQKIPQRQGQTQVPQQQHVNPHQPLKFKQIIMQPQSKIRESTTLSNKRQSRKQKNVGSSDEEGDFGGDSDSDDDQRGQETYFNPVDESEAVKWFNRAEPKDLQEILALNPNALETLISMRPFQNSNTLRAKLKQAKGVSPALFDFYLDLIASYKQVDSVLDRCEEVGEKISTIFNQMDKSDSSKKNPLDDNIVTLKSYQNEGVMWLEHLHQQKVSGILADEMGLGKTLQVIAFISALKHQKQESGPNLIVVPSSTLENWLREFYRFAPSLQVRSYYGDQQERMILRDDLYNTRDQIDVLITTYNLAQGSPPDRKFLRKMKFHTAVFDEGHMLKNRETKSYKYLAELKVPWRLLLTGTPLQNNLQELVSLLNFILPEYFQDTEEALRVVFKVKSGVQASVLSKERVSRAKKMMQPFVLRRKKAQVLTDLPKKTELVQYCDLTDSQKAIYSESMARSRRAILEANQTEASTPSESGNESKRGRKRSKSGTSKNKDPSESSSHVLMDLRKAANHPLLFRRHFSDSIIKDMARDCLKEPDFAESVYELVIEDMEVMTDGELQHFAKTYKSVNKYILPDEVFDDSGKVEQLMKILKESKERGDRVLVFSQFTMMLDILCRIFEQRDIKYLMLTGQTQVEERQILVDEFFEDKSIDVFLLSTKAGGLGINLTAANVVIIFDSDWNPHADRQAGDRAFRIGQNKEVTIHKFVSKGTIEEDMLKLAETKLKLDKAVGGGEGAYGGEGDENDEDGETTEKVAKASLLATIRNRLDEDEKHQSNQSVAESEFISQLQANDKLPPQAKEESEIILHSEKDKQVEEKSEQDALKPAQEQAILEADNKTDTHQDVGKEVKEEQSEQKPQVIEDKVDGQNGEQVPHNNEENHE